MASSSGSDQPVTWLRYSEPRCCQCSKQSHCNRDEYCACRSKHVHCTNCLAQSCTNRNILLGPAVEVQVPPCHHLPPQVSHGTLPAHLPPEVWSSQRPAPLPPPSLAHSDISWDRVVQSEPLSRSSFNTPGNQATPSPRHAMLVSHPGGRTVYILYPSLNETVSGSQSSSSSPAHVNPSWNQVTTRPSPNLSVVQPESLVRDFNPSSSPLFPQGMQTVYIRPQVAPVHPTGNRTIVLPHQSTSTQVPGSQPTRQQQLHVDAAYTQDSLFQPSVSRVLPSGSHPTPALSRIVLVRAPGVQATLLQPASSQVSEESQCCKCTWRSRCKSRSCACHAKKVRCTNCIAERCSNREIVRASKLKRCCECTDPSQCSKTRSCDCLSRSLPCANCVAEKCSNRCCRCDEKSDCTKNDNCDCRIKDRRCFEGCRATCCTNYKTTTKLTECCQCNEESECNSNNCACHSRHTRCSANCVAGGCTNNKLTGECKDCCRCNRESKCDSENCECFSDKSPCSSRCFATGCVKQRHTTVMGQKVESYLSKKRIQRIVNRQTTTSDDKSKTTRPILQDTTLTSSIPASHQGPTPANTEFLNGWFPRLDTQPYIIPPVHFDTVYVQKVNLKGGHSIKVLKTQEEREQGQDRRVNKTVKIDRILKKIHYCLSHIKREAARQGEVMVIMSQAKCSLYGAYSRSLYSGAAAMNTDSRDKEALDLREEFVDLVVIHRQHGVMMAATIPTTEENPERLQEDIRKAVDYLQKAKKVVEDCVVNDVKPKPSIHRAVLLPNVTRDCLQGQLVKISDLRELEQRLGVEPGRSFGEFCLCDDDMADNTRVERWWTTCLKRDAGADRPMMGKPVYRQLVTKFVTPLTTVQMYLSTEPRLQLWTLHDVVHEVGEAHGRDLSRIALFPRQLELVEDLSDQNKDDVIILYGPPGSAKTFLLLIKGVLWLKEGCGKVYVVQTRPEDGAASAFLVAHQLEKTARQGPDSVQLINTEDFWDSGMQTWAQGGEVKYQAWVQQLCDHARDVYNPTKAVHILADEANCDHVSSIVKTLQQREVRVRLWAAGVKLDIPADLQDNVRMLTEPLRSPPSVVREVEKANDMKDSTVPAYSVPPVAPPCDGPPLIKITHYYNEQGHKTGYPWRCEECGKKVARVLLHDLHVGRRDNAAPGLKYNDVFVTGSQIECRTNTPDDNNSSPAPFIRGLQSAGIPTRQVSRDDRDAIRRVAENAWPATATGATGGGEDAVTVVREGTVWGLERKVVVYLEGDSGDFYANRTGRLRSFSRATSQVIHVKNNY